jgi:Glyoxalase superfamily protein
MRSVIQRANCSSVQSGVNAMSVDFQRVIPILRIFSVEKAREFYVDYLGFSID